MDYSDGSIPHPNTPPTLPQTQPQPQISQACLGTTLDVLTLDGMVELRLPSGVQHDTMLVMRGRGVRELQGSRRGNQIVHVKVEIPKSMTPRYVCMCVRCGMIRACCVVRMTMWDGEIDCRRGAADGLARFVNPVIPFHFTPRL